MWLPILIAFFPYSSFWSESPDMTCSLSSTRFSPWKHTCRNSVSKSSFWIPPMMLTPFMNTAGGKISRPLLTWTQDIPDILLIKMSPLTMTVFLSVRWAYVCTKIDMRLPSTEQSTSMQAETGLLLREPLLPDEIRQNDTHFADNPRLFNIRQGTAKHGKRNLTEGLLWNALISVRKRTIN